MTALTMSMWTTSVVVMMMVIQGGSTGGKFDWCEHHCNDQGRPRTKHSMCALPEGGGDNCKSYTRGLTQEEKQQIVHLHNQLRAQVANGQETRGVGGAQPTAADMMELVWDDEVAMIAQRWADQCRQGAHDKCRKTMDGASVGQNVGAMAGYGKNPARVDMITDLVKAWYDEVKDMATSDVDSVFRSSRGVTGHYTQLVWGRTSRIGCGMAHLSTGRFDLKFVCNYKVSGNYGGKPIYTKGAPASKCPYNSQPSTTYSGLCKSNGKEDFSEPTLGPGDLSPDILGQLPKSGNQFPSAIGAKHFPFFKTGRHPGIPQTPSSIFEVPVSGNGDNSQALASIFKMPESYTGAKPQIIEIPISPNGQPQTIGLPTTTSSPQAQPTGEPMPITGKFPIVMYPIQDMTGSNQAPVEQPKKKKKSLFWRIITLPWRILKWLLSIPFRIFEFIKNRLFS